MEYDIFGPFPLRDRKRRFIGRDAHSQKIFWTNVASECEGLNKACGCYIFVVNNKPYYVGKTEARSFDRECLTPRNQNIFKDVLNERYRGKPSLYLIAKLTKNGRRTRNGRRFAKPSKTRHSDIEFLETLFIGQALKKNPNLENILKTKKLKKMHVPGFLNTRRGSNTISSSQLKVILG